MKKYLFLIAVSLQGVVSSCIPKEGSGERFTGAKGEVKLITLDPGHFHAALVQKKSQDLIANQVYVYAPDGNEVKEHLKLVESYNNRTEDPTNWEEHVYLGSDFLDRMLIEKKGNVVVTAGNNQKKTAYIKEALAAGFNVLADKPMAINDNNFELLQECFKIAKKQGLMLYDIMTERYEITTILQRLFSTMPTVYGEQLKGSIEEPAIVKESVHHFFKLVSGSPLKRPAWFFDVNQEGDGIVDVTTHLVDLVQWETFPNQIIHYDKDIEMIDANRWTTSISKEEFEQVTGENTYPEFLQKDVENDTLKVFCNGDILYKIKGVTAKVSVIWNYTFPKGGGDTHYSVMKGSKADLVIRQGKEQNYIPELYIETVEGVDLVTYENDLNASMEKVVTTYPGISLKRISENVWKVEIPDKYRVGHEAHFGQVMDSFLQYLKDGKLPDWEVPNMLAKYYVTTSALSMAKEKRKVN